MAMRYFCVSFPNQNKKHEISEKHCIIGIVGFIF